MSSPLNRTRVAFGADDEISNEIDLSGYVLRGIYSPAGHALGEITVHSRTPDMAETALVPLTLDDGDETATLLRPDADWPLWLTTISVEHTRVEPFELFLVTEHRG